MQHRLGLLVACLGALSTLTLPAAAQTFAPVVRASIQDSPRDGLGDAFSNPPFEGLLRQTASTEERAIQEFDVASLSGAAIQSATLSGKVSVNNSFDNGPRTFSFSLYAGNGTAELTDFQIAATQVGVGQYHPPMDTSFNYSFDVAAVLQTFVSAGTTHIGLRVDCTSEPNFPNILDLATSQLVVTTATCGVVTTFCTAGTTTNGCTASMSGTGTPDANAGSGFTIDVTNVEGQRLGLIFYGLDNTGFTPLAWGASTSFLCVKPPTQRLPPAGTGGTAGACDGALTIDFNSYLAANPAILGAPFAGGEQVYAQAWFRDPPSPKTTMLSDALSFTLCP